MFACNSAQPGHPATARMAACQGLMPQWINCAAAAIMGNAVSVRQAVMGARWHSSWANDDNLASLSVMS